MIESKANALGYFFQSMEFYMFQNLRSDSFFEVGWKPFKEFGSSFTSRFIYIWASLGLHLKGTNLIVEGHILHIMFSLEHQTNICF